MGKEVGGLNSYYGGKLKGEATKFFFSKGGGLLFTGVDPSGILSELPTYFSLF